MMTLAFLLLAVGSVALWWWRARWSWATVALALAIGIAIFVGDVDFSQHLGIQL